MRLNGDVVVLPLTRAGFIQAPLSSFNNYFFSNPDCTGQAIFDGGPSGAPTSDGLLTNSYQIINNVVYYPQGVIQTVQSQLAYFGGQSCPTGSTPTSPGFCCFTFAPGTGPFEAMGTFDLTTLGLVPPFHVEGP
jgi:hypothetical protein